MNKNFNNKVLSSVGMLKIYCRLNHLFGAYVNILTTCSVIPFWIWTYQISFPTCDCVRCNTSKLIHNYEKTVDHKHLRANLQVPLISFGTSEGLHILLFSNMICVFRLSDPILQETFWRAWAECSFKASGISRAWRLFMSGSLPWTGHPFLAGSGWC